MTDICRLCASLKRLDRLTTLGDPILDAARKLARCCQLDFPPPHDEFLPQNVCHECVADLNASNAFAERVQQAQETLRQAFLVDMQLMDGAPTAATSIHHHKDEAPEPINAQHETANMVANETNSTRIAVTPTEPTFKIRSVIISLHLKGYSVVEIAKRLQLDEHIVNDWIFTYQTYAQCGVEMGEQQQQPTSPARHQEMHPDDVTTTGVPMAPEWDVYAVQQQGDGYDRTNVIEILDATTDNSQPELVTMVDDDETESASVQEMMKTESSEELCLTDSNELDPDAEDIELEAEQFVQPSESAFASDEQHLDSDKPDEIVATTPQTPPAARPTVQSEIDRLLEALDDADRLSDGMISAGGLQRMVVHNQQRALPTWQQYPWNCSRCSTNCGSAAGVRRHYQSAHAPHRVQYACRDCPKTLVKYRAFVDHVRQRHEPLLRLCCDVCSTHFWDGDRLREHRAGHPRMPTTATAASPPEHTHRDSNVDGDELPDGGDTVAALRLDDGQCVDTCVMECVDTNECDMCWKPFATRQALMAHRAKAHGGASFAQRRKMGVDGAEALYSCELCCKTFKTQLRMLKHHTVHTGQKPYKCDQCGREFREKGTLREHIRIHTGAMPFACEFCGKRFRFKGVLTTHRRQHTGERPYSCVECDHHFANWPNYNKHMKRKHGINTSVNVRKPQAIPPSGMPAKAKLNHVVPTAENVNTSSNAGTAPASPPPLRSYDDMYGCVPRSQQDDDVGPDGDGDDDNNADNASIRTAEQQRYIDGAHVDIEYMTVQTGNDTGDDEPNGGMSPPEQQRTYYIPVPLVVEAMTTQPK